MLAMLSAALKRSLEAKSIRPGLALLCLVVNEAKSWLSHTDHNCYATSKVTFRTTTDARKSNRDAELCKDPEIHLPPLLVQRRQLIPVMYLS